MRLLFVNPYYKPYLGGIERIIERLSAELLTYREVEAIGVLTTRAQFPDRILHDLPGHEVVDGVDIFRLTFRPAALPRLFHPLLAGYLSPALPRVLRRFKPDLIHFTYSEWWSANLQTYLVSRGVPHVLSTFFHGWARNQRTLPLYATNRWLTSRVQAIHTLTEVERQQVHRAYGAPLDRTMVIPPGVDVPAALPDRRGRDAVTILAVGRLNDDKGQLRLVEMVDRLSREDSAPAVQLWLAGDDAGTGRAIVEHIARRNLHASVRLFGHCSDEQLQDLYRGADIFALPTRHESFGLVFIEAMAHALPVVTYGVGPIPSILRQGALLAPPGDEQTFLDALRSLVREPARRLALGREGYALAGTLYSWSGAARQFFDLYERSLYRTVR